MDKPKVIRGKRKTSPRTKGLRKISAASQRLRELWQQPEFRERMRQRDRAWSLKRKVEKLPGPRYGVPDGYRKRDVLPLIEKARETADKLIGMMKEEGLLPDVPVPGSDEAKAEAALHHATIIALSPGDKKVQLQAIRTVLEWTRAKPESKSKVTVSKAEDFLAAVAEDMQNDE